MAEAVSAISKLNMDVLLQIFSLLAPHEVWNLRGVSRVFRDTADSSWLWRRMLLHLISNHIPLSLPTTTTTNNSSHLKTSPNPTTTDMLSTTNPPTSAPASTSIFTTRTPTTRAFGRRDVQSLVMRTDAIEREWAIENPSLKRIQFLESKDITAGGHRGPILKLFGGDKWLLAAFEQNLEIWDLSEKKKNSEEGMRKLYAMKMPWKVVDLDVKVFESKKRVEAEYEGEAEEVEESRTLWIVMRMEDAGSMIHSAFRAIKCDWTEGAVGLGTFETVYQERIPLSVVMSIGSLDFNEEWFAYSTMLREPENEFSSNMVRVMNWDGEIEHNIPVGRWSSVKCALSNSHLVIGLTHDADVELLIYDVQDLASDSDVIPLRLSHTIDSYDASPHLHMHISVTDHEILVDDWLSVVLWLYDLSASKSIKRVRFTIRKNFDSINWNQTADLSVDEKEMTFSPTEIVQKHQLSLPYWKRNRGADGPSGTSRFGSTFVYIGGPGGRRGLMLNRVKKRPGVKTMDEFYAFTFTGGMPDGGEAKMLTLPKNVNMIKLEDTTSVAFDEGSGLVVWTKRGDKRIFVGRML